MQIEIPSIVLVLAWLILMGALGAGAYYLGHKIARARFEAMHPPVKPRPVKQDPYVGGETTITTQMDPEGREWHFHIRLNEEDFIRLDQATWDEFKDFLSTFWQVLGGTDLELIPPEPLQAKDEPRRVP